MKSIFVTRQERLYYSHIQCLQCNVRVICYVRACMQEANNFERSASTFHSRKCWKLQTRQGATLTNANVCFEYTRVPEAHELSITLMLFIIVRSFASVALTMAQKDSSSTHFDYFTLDLNEVKL